MVYLLCKFHHVLTILGWLQCFKVFKIDYLITSHVRFGTVSIDAVTYVVICSSLPSKSNCEGKITLEHSLNKLMLCYLLKLGALQFYLD